jgi:regulator of sirC expression with transglutaminase-like and TPR domain
MDAARRADLLAFAHVVGRPEAEIDLGRAALLIAEAFASGLDVARWVSLLDDLGDQLRRRLGSDGDRRGEAGARALCSLLFDELGFVGNEADYYDPRNSFLDQVLERRTGIPITLAVVMIEVARRGGVPAAGIGFPGHFLVRVEGDGAPAIVDPFRGRILGPDEQRALHARVTGSSSDPDPRLFAPATKHQILVRMLNNLRSIYRSRLTVGESDAAPLRAVLDRLLVLAPDDGHASAELASLTPRPDTLN